MREEYCGNCKYSKYDKEYGDWVCCCPDSEYFTDGIGFSDWCEEYVEKE